MAQRTSTFIFLVFILATTCTHHASACTIFMANDGQHVWIGNNEDEIFSTKYRLWYYPAQKENFGYMIWTELKAAKILYGFMHKYPQGGLNEHGLFMDYTAIDEVAVIKDPNKKDPNKTEIYTWLGVAYKKDNNAPESTTNFSKALSQNPNDYLATLWGRQENQKVTFKLNDFEGAEQVLLMGEFTQWGKNAIKMTKENGVWTCEAIIPKGENIYKFRVNNDNLTDKINTMYVGTGPDMYSKIYVW
jgi:penicillin V acylase-like amidase (Ntn superfamily)